jgi:hypothetical protein
MARNGALTKVKQEAQAKAEALGIDPFETLLLFAAARWKELGYDSKTKTIYTSEGSSYEVETISPELRVKAAQEATNYILAKRKAIELDVKDIPDEVFDGEVERRINLKILNGEKVG